MSRRLLLLLVACLLAVPGVAQARDARVPQPRGATVTLVASHDGTVREFSMYVAPRVPALTPVPLLLALHGLYGDQKAAQQTTGFDRVADSEDVALVYPSGADKSWNAGTCCGSAAANRSDDVGLLVEVVRMASLARPIDLDRVYIAGFSNGGMMSLRAACDRPDVFAAAASVGGTLVTPCSGRTPVSALLLHGNQDQTVPFAGARYSTFLRSPLAPVPSAASALARRSGCRGAVVTHVPGQQRTRYRSCAEGTQVELLALPGMGHSWPTAAGSGLDGGQVVWLFLAAQRR